MLMLVNYVRINKKTCKEKHKSAAVYFPDFIKSFLFNMGEDSGQGNVHSFNDIRQWVEFGGQLNNY
jgi:hypothetical protein